MLTITEAEAVLSLKREIKILRLAPISFADTVKRRKSSSEGDEVSLISMAQR